MGEIEEGDEVIGSGGEPVEVMGTYPQGKKDIYEVEFADGASTRVCKDHLWAVRTSTQRYRDKPAEVKSTKELIGDLRFDVSGDKKWYIPVLSEPIQYDNDPAYLVSPYALGLLLGDGTINEQYVNFATDDPELVEGLKEGLPASTEVKNHDAEYTYGITEGKRYEENTVHAELKQLDVCHRAENKHIPDKYKYGPVEARVAIMQGLLDTDGSATQSSATFSSASQQLAEDLQEIVRSLGGICSLHTSEATYTTPSGETKEGQDRHRLWIRLPEHINPFKLQRKLDALDKPHSAKTPTRSIEKIGHVGREKAKCISVDAEDSLYVTSDHVLTHNTIEAIGAIQHMDAYPALIVCPATLKYNWQKEWNTWLPRRAAKVQEASEGLDLRGSVSIINYAILWRYREKLREHDWNALVLDESHKIKNGSAKRSKAAKQIARRMDDDALKMLLSGTAVVNRPKELINQLKVIDVFEREFGGFYPYTKRFCFPKGSPVLMSDFSTKPVENVEVGDKVMGWKVRDSGHRALTETEVEETFQRRSPVQDTELDNGDIISHTPDHEFLNGAHIRNKNCKRWVKALPGSERENTHFDAQLAKVWTPEKPERSRDTENYKHGYLVGAFRGDGWMTKRVKKTYKPFRNKDDGHAVDYTIGIATGDREIVDACERFLRDVYGYEPNRNLRDGMHRLTCGSGREKLYQGLQEVRRNDNWFAGFLAGIYDTDGSHKMFGQYKSHNQSTYDLIEEGLLHFGFDFRSHNEGHSVRGGREAVASS